MLHHLYIAGTNWDPMEYFNPDLATQYQKFFQEAFGEEVPLSEGKKKVSSFIANCSKWVNDKTDSMGKWLTNAFAANKDPKTASQILDEIGVIKKDGKGSVDIKIPASDDSTVTPMQPKDIDYALSPIDAAFQKDKNTVTIKFDQVAWGRFKKKMQGPIKGQEGTKNQFIQTIVSAANLVGGRGVIAMAFIKDKFAQKELIRYAELLQKNTAEQLSDDDLTTANNICSNLHKTLSAIAKQKSGEYEVTVGEIQEFSKSMAIVFDKIKAYDDTDASYGEKWMKAADDFVKILNEIQYGINEITKCMQDVYVINPSYCNTIRDIETLSVFVDKMINSGIPSKYISFNVYMASHSDLKGNGDALNPTWGESRCIFFPTKNSDSVYKIAINPLGIQGNRIESNVWAAVKDTDGAKWLAAVKSVSVNRTVLEMERCDTKRRGLVGKTLDMPKMQSKVKQICKDLKIRDISGDIHPENIGFRGKQPCVIDYGSFK